MSTDSILESPLDTAETSFRLLAVGPGGLFLDCASLAPDLPQGPIGLLELRLLLASQQVTDEARDAVWRELVVRARGSRSTWAVAAVGMAIPALRMIAVSLTRSLTWGNPIDVDIEIMAGYLRALQRLDLGVSEIRPRLCEAGRRAGERAVRYLASKAERRRLPGESPPPPRPWPHPDLVLVDAVAQGVLSELDAELISLTRLEVLPLRPSAVRPGVAGKGRHRREPSPPANLLMEEPEPLTPSPSSTSSSSEVEEEVPQTSTRSQGTPDAETATDPKGGRGTTSGSAWISSPASSAISRGIIWAAWRRAAGEVKLPDGTWHRWQASVRRTATQIPLVTAIIALAVAAMATSALASSRAAAAASDLNAVFTNLRNWLIGLLAALATLMLTVGGLRYLVAGGDPGEVQKAKAALKAAAFGYALAVLAPLFVNVLKRVVGG